MTRVGQWAPSVGFLLPSWSLARMNGKHILTGLTLQGNMKPLSAFLHNKYYSENIGRWCTRNIRLQNYWLMHIRNVRDLAIKYKRVNPPPLGKRQTSKTHARMSKNVTKSSSKQEPKDAWHMREAQDSVCMQQPSAGRMEPTYLTGLAILQEYCRG